MLPEAKVQIGTTSAANLRHVPWRRLSAPHTTDDRLFSVLQSINSSFPSTEPGVVDGVMAYLLRRLLSNLGLDEVGCARRHNGLMLVDLHAALTMHQILRSILRST
jgi:hypothetical protein